MNVGELNLEGVRCVAHVARGRCGFAEWSLVHCERCDGVGLVGANKTAGICGDCLGSGAVVRCNRCGSPPPADEDTQTKVTPAAPAQEAA